MFNKTQNLNKTKSRTFFKNNFCVTRSTSCQGQFQNKLRDHSFWDQFQDFLRPHFLDQFWVFAKPILRLVLDQHFLDWFWDFFFTNLLARLIQSLFLDHTHTQADIFTSYISHEIYILFFLLTRKNTLTCQREQHRHSVLLDSWGGGRWCVSRINISFKLNWFLANMQNSTNLPAQS